MILSVTPLFSTRASCPTRGRWGRNPPRPGSTGRPRAAGPSQTQAARQWKFWWLSLPALGHYSWNIYTNLFIEWLKLSPTFWPSPAGTSRTQWRGPGWPASPPHPPPPHFSVQYFTKYFLLSNQNISISIHKHAKYWPLPDSSPCWPSPAPSHLPWTRGTWSPAWFVNIQIV